MRQVTAKCVGRWSLIVAETLVVAFIILGRPFQGERATGSDGYLIFATLASLAWLFLFLGTPFLVPSQRGLAVCGWLIAVGTIVVSAIR